MRIKAVKHLYANPIQFIDNGGGFTDERFEKSAMLLKVQEESQKDG